MIHVHPFAIATRLIEPSAISHWSAMNYHGLIEQIPQDVTAFTPKKVVTPSMRNGNSDNPLSDHAWETGGIRYRYVSVRPEAYFGIEEAWVDSLFRVPIADRERAMLEGFISPRYFGGMGEILGILEEHLDHLDAEKLAGYALRYGKTSVAKRLGWSLERFGAPESVLSPLKIIPMSGFRVLDPTWPRDGVIDPIWRIQDNLSPGSKRR